MGHLSNNFYITRISVYIWLWRPQYSLSRCMRKSYFPK